jgi:dienelactone hydrolase
MRVFDQPQTAGDTRADIDRGTNTLFFMTPFANLDAWESYAEELRRRFLVACGLYPMPERTPLNAKIYDTIEHSDYIVEKAYFESHPGLLVTGNIYRPVGEGPFPAVICPHGHWEHGRLEEGDRGSVPARCITMARMGMVVFSYDMVGYNDSCQLGHDFAKSDAERKQQALWGLHPFSVQLWSSIRALDFMESLPYVDPNNLNCTGASGGGTQTFALNAVDRRVKVSAPVNMISHSMQGGCVCENAPIIRFNASNMEVGALAAPRPMLMVSATGDWTRETPSFEYPAIRGIYELYGVADRVASVQIDAGHNYNQDSREAMYRFFGKWVLGKESEFESYTEPAYTIEPVEALRNFPDGTPPAGYPGYDELIARIIDATRSKWAAELPSSSGDFLAFRAKARPALADIVAAALPCEDSVSARAVSSHKADGFSIEGVVLSDGAASAIPALVFRPADNKPTGVVVVVHGKGKAVLATGATGGPGPYVRALMDEGRVVVTIDPFLIGENLSPWNPAGRRSTTFPDTFLPTDTAYRIQDVLTALIHARSIVPSNLPLDLVGLDEAGLWCLFASALHDGIRTTLVDANTFAVDDDAAWVNGPYMPCIRAIGDVATAAALHGHRTLRVFNTTTGWDNALAAYAAVSGRALADTAHSGPLTADAMSGAL